MSKVVCLSRKQVIERLQESQGNLLDTHNVISLLDTGMVSPFITSVFSGYPEVQSFRKALVTVHVDDITPGKDDPIWYQEFTASAARRIVRWFHNSDKSRPYIVHCWAGISRSGAVGFWLSKQLGILEDEFRQANPQVKPNKHILEMMDVISKAYSQADPALQRVDVAHVLPWERECSNECP